MGEIGEMQTLWNRMQSKAKVMKNRTVVRTPRAFAMALNIVRFIFADDRALQAAYNGQEGAKT
jgi:3-hydroxyisobutyrate dehydrogenase-like beta-hydroxyacid dehydrogenase